MAIRFLKKSSISFFISGFFCTFVPQKNIIYLCLKTQDLSVAQSSLSAISPTFSPCLPGRN